MCRRGANGCNRSKYNLSSHRRRLHRCLSSRAACRQRMRPLHIQPLESPPPAAPMPVVARRLSVGRSVCLSVLEAAPLLFPTLATANTVQKGWQIRTWFGEAGWFDGRVLSGPSGENGDEFLVRYSDGEEHTLTPELIVQARTATPSSSSSSYSPPSSPSSSSSSSFPYSSSSSSSSSFPYSSSSSCFPPFFVTPGPVGVIAAFPVDRRGALNARARRARGRGAPSSRSTRRTAKRRRTSAARPRRPLRLRARRRTRCAWSC